jgi:ribonuclease HI
MEQLEEKALNIYTDGSCYDSPRMGGVGYLFVSVDDQGHPQIHEECPPGWRSATNNQMELQACIEALGLALGRRSPVDMAKFHKIVIRSDSQYVVDNFDKAKFEWPGTRWTTRGGAPVANTTQWKELMRLVKKAGVRVEARWEGAWKGPLEQASGQTRQAVGEDAKHPAARSPASSSKDEPAADRIGKRRDRKPDYQRPDHHRRLAPVASSVLPIQVRGHGDGEPLLPARRSDSLEEIVETR